MKNKKNISKIKKILLTTISLYYIGLTTIMIYANNGLLGGIKSKEDLRTGNVEFDDIPRVIKFLIDTFIAIAGTVSVVFVIIGAYKLMFGSIQGDIGKGKDTIVMAITGFTISVLSWFIVKFIFDNL